MFKKTVQIDSKVLPIQNVYGKYEFSFSINKQPSMFLFLHAICLMKHHLLVWQPEIPNLPELISYMPVSNKC